MFETIFLILLCFYFLITVFLITGVKKTFSSLKDEELPSVSVIVAARDEEKNIADCLKSLNLLIYPQNKLEIIIVDDSSSDSTGKLVDEFIADKASFKKITASVPTVNLKGKPNAIASGIKAASGEIILLTDADCTPPPLWVQKTASYYSGNVGMVNGFTTQSVNNSFSGMQAVDLIYLISVASGMINNGFPVSCIGNNMSFRKDAYLRTGGYESLPFSVTEDFALLNAMHNLKEYKIIYPLDKDTLVVSKPCGTLKELYLQKKRWASGGKKVPLRGVLILANAFLVSMFILMTPLFFSRVYLYLVFFKISIDFFFLLPVHKSLGISKNLSRFSVISFELYLTIYTAALPFIAAFSRKVRWKGREY